MYEVFSGDFMNHLRVKMCRHLGDAVLAVI